MSARALPVHSLSFNILPQAPLLTPYTQPSILPPTPPLYFFMYASPRIYSDTSFSDHTNMNTFALNILALTSIFAF